MEGSAKLVGVDGKLETEILVVRVIVTVGVTILSSHTAIVHRTGCACTRWGSGGVWALNGVGAICSGGGSLVLRVSCVCVVDNAFHGTGSGVGRAKRGSRSVRVVGCTVKWVTHGAVTFTDLVDWCSVDRRITTKGCANLFVTVHDELIKVKDGDLWVVFPEESSSVFIGGTRGDGWHVSGRVKLNLGWVVATSLVVGRVHGGTRKFVVR